MKSVQPSPATPSAAAGYHLVWQESFSSLDLCTGTRAGCTWYNPGLWYAEPAGSVAVAPDQTLQLLWAQGQSNASTSVSTAPQRLLGARAWRFGYFEVRMRFDPVAGSWPGLWMISPEDGPGNETDNRLYPELDLFEWQSNSPTLFQGTIHVWRNSKFLSSAGITPAVSNVDFSKFNTYGMLWTPTAVSWFLNDRFLGKVDTTTVPFQQVFGGQQAMFLVLSQQAGCHWSSHCEPQGSPLQMNIASVRVYQQGAAAAPADTALR